MEVSHAKGREVKTSTSATSLAMELNTFKGVRIAENVSIALIVSGAGCKLLNAEPIFWAISGTWLMPAKLCVASAIFPFTNRWSGVSD